MEEEIKFMEKGIDIEHFDIDNLIKQLRTPQVIRPKDDLFKQLVSVSFDEMYYIRDMLMKCNIKLEGDDTLGFTTSVINK